MRKIIESVKPVDQEAYRACIARFDGIAKPIGSLGLLEELLGQIAAITGSPEIDITKKCVLVFCADNGIVKQGVAQSDHTVTTLLAKMMADGKASVCTMAKTVHADVFPIDIGMRDTVDGLLSYKVMTGTRDMTCEAAMNLSEMEQAIITGIELVKNKKESGYRIIATGEAGIGNTTTASAMASQLLKLPVEDVTGRGAGLSDLGLKKKKTAIQKAIEVNHPNQNDPMDILAKLGGLDIAAMTGVFLGGAAYRIPIVMDGVISAVAALTAVRICPLVRDYIVPSHISAEPAGRLLIQELGVTPVLQAQMRLGEGTGAVALFPILDMAAAIYNYGTTFADIALDAYVRMP
jgi:nicotinate-nucleotide--dimethylbenzimidazole phosphoribosyltransferase